MMKEKKSRETLRQEKNDANKAFDDVFSEMNDDEINQITGAGNPFAKYPRPNPQPIDDPDVRENG